MATGGRRGRVLLGLGLLVGCHWSPPPGRFPGAMLTVRVQGPVSGWAKVTVDGAAVIPLRSVDADEVDGAFAVLPGAHRLELRSGEQVLGQAQVDVGHFEAAQVLFFQATPADAGHQVVGILVSPVTSLVAGQPLRLRTGPGPASASRWSVSPPGCGTLAEVNPSGATFVAAHAGTCRVKVAEEDRHGVSLLVRGGGAAFPLRPAPGGRWLEDRNGAPFLLKGESAWLALVNLDPAEQDAWLADRAARGFNLVEVSLLNHDYTHAPSPEPPRNRTGEQPFRRAGDFSVPEDAYFRRAVEFVDRAARLGIAVLVAPMYLGFDGGREGWWAELGSATNTREVCAGFGRYLGALFRDAPNVLWLAGGDFAPPSGSEGEARHWALLEGIRAAGATQPWAGHWNFEHQGGLSTDQARFAPAMSLNGVYQYANVWGPVLRAFDVSPARPVFLLESTYEHEHPDSNTQPFRKAWWWAMTSGASGMIWGNLFLWTAEAAAGVHRATYGETDRSVSSWRAEWDSPGTHQAVNLHGFFEALPWQRLLPAGSAVLPELVTAGQKAKQGHLSVAATREKDLLVAYVPPTGGRRQRFSLDLSGMPGPACARWYDPVAGAVVHRWTLPHPAREEELETPGANASGWNDWALVVEGTGRCVE